METLLIQNGSSKKPDLILFRRGTEEDVRKFRFGQCVWFLANNGTAKQCSINSSLKTWKKKTASRPYDMQISIKYGLYEHDQWRNCGCDDDDFSRFLIPIEALI